MAWLIQRAGPLRPGLFPASAASRDPTCAQKGSEATETGDRHDRLQDRFPLSPQNEPERTPPRPAHHPRSQKTADGLDIVGTDKKRVQQHDDLPLLAGSGHL
ncbi:hypothetical protein [Novosphingobium sp.]|uniref:hypothetical protein n=1 Tax=Novosphingobium sp. TaxID=1874826 RepID=UPI0031D8B6DB